MQKRFIPRLPLILGAVYLLVAVYNYCVQGLTEHNVMLLLAAAIINIAWVIHKTAGTVLLGIAGCGFMEQGYAKDAAFLVVFVALIIILDCVVVKKMNAVKKTESDGGTGKI